MAKHVNIEFALLLFLFISCFLLTGCNSLQTRIDKAETIARNNDFKKEVIKTRLFSLISYQKYSPVSKSAVIYIEGDGLSWIKKNRISNNPTPNNPLVLKLASTDPSPIVIYIARPCQYIDAVNNPGCEAAYWTNKRASIEVIDSINTAISMLKEKLGFTQIRLVGYSGGATIAAILSVSRDDVTDLRTIAGNLDINTFSKVHSVSPLYGSLNPIDYADKLVKIPQIHYVSKRDNIITSDITQSYAKSLMKYDSELKCYKLIELEDPTHSKGWTTVWQNQFAQKQYTENFEAKLDCSN